MICGAFVAAHEECARSSNYTYSNTQQKAFNGRHTVKMSVFIDHETFMQRSSRLWGLLHEKDRREPAGTVIKNPHTSGPAKQPSRTILHRLLQLHAVSCKDQRSESIATVFLPPFARAYDQVGNKQRFDHRHDPWLTLIAR